MPSSGQQQNAYQIPNSRPKKKRGWLKWLVIIIVTVAILIAVTPYLFAFGLLISLKNSNQKNDLWNELWVVPQEHSLAPIPDLGSGQGFTVGPMMFSSPLANTSVGEVLPSDEGTKFVSGNKSFSVFYNNPSDTNIASAIISFSNLGTSTIMDANGKIESAYQLWLEVNYMTPGTVFSTPKQTLNNIGFLKTKAYAASSVPLLVSHTQYINSISQLLSDSDHSAGSIKIFDKSGNNIFNIIFNGLTQGEVDALINSIQIATTSSNGI